MPKLDADFYARVYAVVQLVPCGRVTTYGAIAQFLGLRGSARMVGHALQHCPVHPLGAGVPAHRVVNHQGLLTGAHHFGPPGMAALLEAEGVRITDGKVQDFHRLLWQPHLHVADSF